MKWLQEGVLLKEPSPAMYLLDEEFRFGGRARHRLIKMKTLGHTSVPARIHAGGLRYHGMAPLIVEGQRKRDTSEG